MNARYRKLYTRIWHHPSFQALSAEDKVLALYLLTGPQTNRIGYYRLSLGEVGEDLGTPPRGVREGLRRVCGAFDWAFDAASKVLLIPSWWTWNEPESANNLIGALKDLPEVPRSGLFAAFIRASSAVRAQHNVPLPKGYGSPPEGVPDPSPTQEQEQEQVQEQEYVPPSPVAPAVVVPESFDRFWDAYPRKVGKQDARKAWRVIKPDDALSARILAAITRLRLSRQWLRDGGQYIPHPATWLRRGGWDDEPDAAQPMLSGQSVNTLTAGAAFLKGDVKW